MPSGSCTVVNLFLFIHLRHSNKSGIFRVSHSERKKEELTYTYTFLVKTHIFLNCRGIENCTAFYSPNFAKIRKGLCYQIEVLLIHQFCSKSGQEIIQFYGRTIQPIENEGTGQNHKTVGSVWIDYFGLRRTVHWVPRKRTDNSYLIIDIVHNNSKQFNPKYEIKREQSSCWLKEQVIHFWTWRKGLNECIFDNPDSSPQNWTM